MQHRSAQYVRPAVRALAIQRESFDNWLYLAGRSKGAFDMTPPRGDERRRWKSTVLARFFGMPTVP